MADFIKSKNGVDVSIATSIDHGIGTLEFVEKEVFATDIDGVNFRTVGWIRAAVFFLKMTFATGVLSIPSALYSLGAIAGAVFTVFWGVVNTCMYLCCDSRFCR